MGTEERLEHFREVEMRRLHDCVMESLDEDLNTFNVRLNEKKKKIRERVIGLFDKDGNLICC